MTASGRPESHRLTGWINKGEADVQLLRGFRAEMWLFVQRPHDTAVFRFIEPDVGTRYYMVCDWCREICSKTRWVVRDLRYELRDVDALTLEDMEVDFRVHCVAGRILNYPEYRSYIGPDRWMDDTDERWYVDS